MLLHEDHLEAARDMARKSIVLLQNESDLLPLAKDVGSIAVIGPLANDKDSPIGNWRAQGETDSAVSLLEGIQAAVGDDVEVRYAPGVKLGPWIQLCVGEASRRVFGTELATVASPSPATSASDTCPFG